MSSDAESAAISAITDALRNPTVFDFDPLFRQNAVVALKNHELFSLLQIFANDGLPEFQAWVESHPGVVENYSACVYMSLIHAIDLVWQISTSRGSSAKFVFFQSVH